MQLTVFWLFSDSYVTDFWNWRDHNSLRVPQYRTIWHQQKWESISIKFGLFGIHKLTCSVLPTNETIGLSDGSVIPVSYYHCRHLLPCKGNSCTNLSNRRNPPLHLAFTIITQSTNGGFLDQGLFSLLLQWQSATRHCADIWDKTAKGWSSLNLWLKGPRWRSFDGLYYAISGLLETLVSFRKYHFIRASL